MNIQASRTVRTGKQHFNDLLGVKAFEHGEAVLHNRPVEIYVQVASACNLDCYMCYEHLRPSEARHGRGLKFLEPELFAKIEREIFPYSSRVTFGVGGEPMLCPSLMDYIERAHKHGQHVHVMTNGTLITSEQRAEVMARCLSSLEISVDGATRETYERIRVGAKWDSLLRNIELLNEHRMRYEKQDRTHVTLCMVMMRSNVHELPRYVELSRDLRVDRVAAWHVIPVTEEGREDSLYHDQAFADPYLHEARELAVKYGIEVDFPASVGGDELEATSASPASREEMRKTLTELQSHALLADEEAWARPLTGMAAPAPEASQQPTARRLHCHMPTMTAFVFYDGRVFPCCHPHAHTKMHMGDLAEAAFGEIWNNRRYRNLRVGLATGDAPPLCQNCSILHGTPGASEAASEEAAQGADLASYYGERDLAPMEHPIERNMVDFAADSGMADHIARLEDDNRQKAGHIATIEGELAHLRAHASDLEGELPHLRGHAANLERELPHLRGHAANLEGRLSKIQRNPLYRAGAAVHSLFTKLKR